MKLFDEYPAVPNVVRDRNWYQLFTQELFKHPQVDKNMSVLEAAKVVGETNFYVRANLLFIQTCEQMGISQDDNLFNGIDLPVEITRTDLLQQDYIKLYVSMKDATFARAAGKPPRLDHEACMRWCELYLFWEQQEKGRMAQPDVDD